METIAPPHPAIDLPTQLYYQLVHTLTGLLPPPPDDRPETLLARNHAAIAKVASLLPVNANEADLAAQCIASRAQAEDLLRLLRQHAGDVGLVMRLNAQYGSMVRISLSVHGRLMRVQALRQKREAIDGTANQDAWALHIAERSMLGALDQDSAPRDPTSPEAVPAISPGPPEPTPPEAPQAMWPGKAPATWPAAPRAMWPGTAPANWPGAPQVEPSATSADQRTEEQVSQSAIESHYAAIETWLSEKPWTRLSRRSRELDPQEVLRQATAKAGSGTPK